MRGKDKVRERESERVLRERERERVREGAELTRKNGV